MEQSAPVGRPSVSPPETVEGWFVSHQISRVTRRLLRPEGLRPSLREAMEVALAEVVRPEGGGWSVPVVLVGSAADVMLVHFRPTLEGIEAAERRVKGVELSDYLEPVYSFLSVTEAGLYHLT